MAARTRHRPRRGGGGEGDLPGGLDPEIRGDSGTYAGRQDPGGPTVTEQGDYDASVFGVPQADLPGGKTHIVNPVTEHGKPGGVVERPADYYKFHGVIPQDLGQYELPPDATHDGPGERPEAVPLPDFHDPVPVYVVEGPDDDGRHVTRQMAAYNVNVRAAGSEPSRICGFDPDRVEILLLNEDSTTDIRISEKLDALQQNSAQGTGPAGSGALIWHGTNSYTRLRTQGEVFALTTSTSASARLSVIIITETREKA